jgi:uncharacterized membrane protein YGL010W
VNQRLHTVCVPVIFISLLGLLWAVPVPGSLPAFVNWGSLALLAALVWYLSQSWTLGLGMVAMAAFGVAVILGLERLPISLALSAAALFVVAWIGQFIGHGYEGKRPSFLRDLRFLLVGPLWVVDKLYRRLGLRG